jgi:hypothetical protein
MIYNLKGFFQSIYILLFRSIRKPAIFRGYQNKRFANWYRIKREICWKKSYDQMGKEQFILPFAPGRLLVCSKLEVAAYKKHGLIDKNMNTRKLLKRSL